MSGVRRQSAFPRSRIYSIGLPHICGIRAINSEVFMKTLGYYNGTIGTLEEMTVPMLDRAFYFGDGVYDATCCRNYNIYALDEHVDRFFINASLLGINIPMSKDELCDLLRELVRKLDDGEQFVYWQISRGTGVRYHDFAEDSVGNLCIMLRPRKIRDIYEKIRLITHEDTRFLHCNIKSLNLIPSVIAAHEAESRGCYEAVLHRGDRVTECAHSNVHILKDGTLKTAPADNLILAGTARKHLIDACAKLGVPVSETPFTVSELMDADEVIVSSTTAFCLSASEIDGVPVGGKAPKLLKKLQDLLMAGYLEATK